MKEGTYVNDKMKEQLFQLLFSDKTDMLELYRQLMHQCRLLEEYDEEKALADLNQEFYEDGLIKGKIESILELLDEIGDLPAALRETISTQKDPGILTHWLKLIAKIDSIEEFEILM